jgi:hypothetical protein
MTETQKNSSEEIPQRKLLGEILAEAGLISAAQIDLALQDQSNYINFRIGEIFALRGWLKTETVDFFAEKWLKLLKQEESNHHLLGYYFQAAGLLTEQQINVILKEQKQLGIKFGSIAVLKGFLKQQTIDYFLTQIQQHQTILINLDSQLNTSPKSINNPSVTSTQKSSKSYIPKSPTPKSVKRQAISTAQKYAKNKEKDKENIQLKSKNNDGKDTIITPRETIIIPSAKTTAIQCEEIYYSPISIDY